MRIHVVSAYSCLGWVAAASLIGALGPDAALTQPAMPVDLTGVYELVPEEESLPDGRQNYRPSFQETLTPAALAEARSRDLELDHAKACLPIGPFRMMVRPDNLFEILPSPSTGRIFILFEDYYTGLVRQIMMDRQHDPERPPTYNGDSVGRWEEDTLVVETVNFNDLVWLNSRGAPHSDALRLTERYRLVLDGQFLELEMTAEDENDMTRPYTYTQYYRKVDKEIPQYVCVDDLVQPEVPRID